MGRIILVVLLIGTFIQLPVRAESLSLSAQSAVLLDFETLEVIYEKNSRDKRPMASTTKIITAITVIENCNIDEIVKVSASAASVEGSSVWLEENEELSVLDLLYAMMLESGNDAATALAEHVGGTVEKFADMMNVMCEKIGAKDTHCVTSSGLDDDGHFTTAYDLALISCYAMRNELFKTIVSTKNKTIPWADNQWDRSLSNHNKLLGLYEGCDGVKTGYTSKSGRCLVSSAFREGRRYVAVTLNAPDDWEDHKNMLDYAFQNYYAQKDILIPGEKLGEISVRGSKKNKVSYCARDSYSVIDGSAVPVFEYDLGKYIDAPVKAGDKVGSVTIRYSDFAVRTFDLYSMDDAENNDILYMIYIQYIKTLYLLLELVR